jgi:sugar phosphate isomerase/epimerase
VSTVDIENRERSVVREADGRHVPRIAFGSWAFAFGPFEDNPWDFDRLCRYAADSGYDGVEINGFRPHPHDEDFASVESCVRLRDRIAELGLGISAYAPDFRTTPPAEAPLQDYLARIDSVLAFCRRMNIRTLRTDTVSPPVPLDAGQWQLRMDTLLTAWRAAARRCADSGVTMVWEFEPGFWLNRPSQVVGLLEAVDHPAFRVLFDTSHAYTGAVAGARQGPDPELLVGGATAYARLLAPWLGHLHLIDSDGSLHDEETSAHLPFGSGHVPFDDVLQALAPQAVGLDWWTVEFFFCSTTERDAVTAVPIVQAMAQRANRRTARED